MRHDCVCNHVILSQRDCAGHAETEITAILRTASRCSSSARIGEHAFVGGMIGVEHDVIPYGSGLLGLLRARACGLNILVIETDAS